jgi:hypothetical protein
MCEAVTRCKVDRHEDVFPFLPAFLLARDDVDGDTGALTRLVRLVMRMRGEEQLLENLFDASNFPSVASWSADDAALA